VPRMNSSGSQQRSQSHGSSNAAAATSTETSTTSADHGDRNKTNQSLEVEDEIICKGIHDLGYNHFGLHHLIRTWTCLSYTRRSFNLLARASFLASRKSQLHLRSDTHTHTHTRNVATDTHTHTHTHTPCGEGWLLTLEMNVTKLD
jgi:hypothetical protein